MKATVATYSLGRLTTLTLLVGLALSCKKSDDPTKGFTTKIQNIVPTSVIDDLRSRGMTINEGKVPPSLTGAYLVSPYKLLSPYGTDDSYKKGRVISDYKYQFHDQTSAGDIQYDFTNSGTDKGAGQGAFIAGNGSTFTIFSEDVGVSSTIPYKTLAVMSGEITATGIKKFQYAFIIKEKTGDADNSVLIGVGKGRIWLDGDSLTVPTAKFRIAAPAESTNEGTMLSVK